MSCKEGFGIGMCLKSKQRRSQYRQALIGVFVDPNTTSRRSGLETWKAGESQQVQERGGTSKLFTSKLILSRRSNEVSLLAGDHLKWQWLGNRGYKL